MDPNTVIGGVSNPIGADAMDAGFDPRKLQSDRPWDKEIECLRPSGEPSPDWERYIDSRLEQFCVR